jgi:hypothetical protein
MAGIIHTTVPLNFTRRRLLTGSIGVFAGVAAARGVLAQDDPATPEGVLIPEGGPERLHSLLQMIPASFGPQAEEAGVTFYYADIRRQLESTGVPAYDPATGEMPEGYVDATTVLAIAAQAFQYGAEPAFVDTFGFSPLQAEESLSIGAPPNDLTIFRGGLPIDELPAIWEASGYARETGSSGTEIWTAGREGELDLTTSISQYGLGGLNNVAIFGDTLVFSRYFDDIDTVAAHVAEPSDSIVDHLHLNELIATLSEDTVSAVAMTGAFLELHSLMLPEQAAQAQELFDESAAETGEFPEVRSAIFAITAGAVGPSFVPTGEGTPDASPVTTAEETDGGMVEVRLLVDSEEEAATAVAAVEYRWNTWSSAMSAEPFTELMTVVTAEPDPVVPTVAAIDFRSVASNRVWIDLVLQRDLMAFAWVGDAPVEATPTAAG